MNNYLVFLDFRGQRTKQFILFFFYQGFTTSGTKFSSCLLNLLFVNGHSFKNSQLAERLRGIGTKMVNCDFVESKFELQSHYNANFRKNTLEKGMNTVIHPAMD